MEDTSQGTTKSVYGERVGPIGRIFAVIASLLLFGAPILCVWIYFHVPPFPALDATLGRTGRFVFVLIVLAVTKEFWSLGLKALGPAFQKNPPSLHLCAEKGDAEGLEYSWPRLRIRTHGTSTD